MPRRAATADPFTADAAAELAADPVPGARPPGRPRKTAATVAKKTPTGSRRIGARTATGKVMSKAEMISKVEADLYAIGAMLVGAGELAGDDVCTAVWWETVRTAGGDQERLQAFVSKMVEIVARNDSTLKALAKGSLLFDIAQGASLLFPVLKAVWSHHGPGSRERAEVDQGAEDYADRFPAYTPGR